MDHSNVHAYGAGTYLAILFASGFCTRDFLLRCSLNRSRDITSADLVEAK